MSQFDEDSDWSALYKFRNLGSDTERMEQLFMTSLNAARRGQQNNVTLERLDAKVGYQNGRIGKLETRWLQGAAVLAFLAIALPILLTIVSILIRR